MFKHAISYAWRFLLEIVPGSTEACDGNRLYAVLRDSGTWGFHGLGTNPGVGSPSKCWVSHAMVTLLLGFKKVVEQVILNNDSLETITFLGETKGRRSKFRSSSTQFAYRVLVHQCCGELAKLAVRMYTGLTPRQALSMQNQGSPSILTYSDRWGFSWDPPLRFDYQLWAVIEWWIKCKQMWITIFFQVTGRPQTAQALRIPNWLWIIAELQHC
jgi:hypothetical protein